MSIKISHAEGYSAGDHFGPEIIRRAGEWHKTVTAARLAVKAAIDDMPALCREAGAPRIVWEHGSRHGII